MKYVKLINNTKIPIKQSSLTNGLNFDEIKTDKYNMGLLMGANNLICLDIDIKDDGLNEFNYYIKKYGEPQTAKQTTPSGGYHYIFQISEETEVLKNKTKYRGKGLDIRKGRAYIVCEPSHINYKPYKFIKPLSDVVKMPTSLINWLIEYENATEINNNLLVLCDNKNELITLINNFKNVESPLWFIITSCIKSLLHEYNDFDENELIKIWNKWSKQQPNYNKINNLKIWANIKPLVNLNYLITLFNKDKPPIIIKLTEINNPVISDRLKYYKTIKRYEPLTQNYPAFLMHNNYIFDKIYTGPQFSFEIFLKHKTLILESTTGTGKTTAVCKHINKYLEIQENKKYKILSIVFLISIAEQHFKTFNDENIIMSSYSSDATNYDDDNVVICINSLLKYQQYDSLFFNDYIVYIDECTTFITRMTHNDHLHPRIKEIYILLNRIICNCHKIILSEAYINDNVFNLVENRTQLTGHQEQIYIKNTFKKYKNINVYHCLNENDFYKKIQYSISNKKYFLFGADHKRTVDEYYMSCDSDEKLIITSDEKKELKNVNETFKNKFVFFSPSITCGIDFNIKEKQNVFIHVKGGTITPNDMFQQMTRTRNIKSVYLYIDGHAENMQYLTTPYKPEYETLEACNRQIIAECANIDVLTSLSCGPKFFTFEEAQFLKLYVYNEYTKDIMNTNTEGHLINILKRNEFIYNIRGGERIKLEKKLQKTLKDAVKDKEDIKYNEHITGKAINEIIQQKIEFINVSSNDDMIKYKDVITTENLKNSYHALIDYFADDKFINDKLNRDKYRMPEYIQIRKRWNKIKLLKDIEKEINIHPLEMKLKAEDHEIKFNKVLYNDIIKVFKSEMPIPKTHNEAMTQYISKLKNLFNELNIITSVSKRTMIEGVRNMKTSYAINKNNLKFYMDLNFFKNPMRNNFNEYLLKEYTEEIEIKKQKPDETNEYMNDEPEFLEDAKASYDVLNFKGGKEPVEGIDYNIITNDINGLDYGLN